MIYSKRKTINKLKKNGYIIIKVSENGIQVYDRSMNKVVFPVGVDKDGGNK